MASLRVCAEWRNGTSLLFHLVCLFTLSKVSQLYSLRFACTCGARKVVITSSELFSVIFRRIHKPSALFVPHRACFWTMGLTALRRIQKPRTCSDLLIYLSTQVCRASNGQVSSMFFVCSVLAYESSSTGRSFFLPPHVNM